MKRLGLAVLVVAGLALMATPPIMAQATFGLGIGATMPMGDYGDVASMGFHGAGNVTFKVGAAPVGIRADVAYHRTGLENDIDGSTSLLGGMASVVYNFTTAGQIKPYVLGGLGFYQKKVSVDGFGDADESSLAFGGGLGLNFAMSSATLFAELRYVSITEGDNFVAFNFVPLTVGVRFGR